MKTAQLQVRVSPAQKAEIERSARRAGLGISAFVLAKVLPDRPGRWRELIRDIHRTDGAKIAFAALSGWLAGLGAGQLREAIDAPPPASLSARNANIVAAMVEHVCAAQSVPPPAWTREIEPLSRPEFGSALSSLRLHLLASSPAAFRRRNLFVDTAVGGQV